MNVVVYLVHPEHSEEEASEMMEVRVTNTPFEFVVTSTSAVKVSTPPVESAEVNVVVYSVHPEHLEEAEDDASESIEVSVTKTPFESVVTSTSPVKVSTPPVESVVANVVVYSVHPEQSESIEVRVTKTPLESVVTSTSPVNVSTPPVESVLSNVVVYSVHPEHSEEAEDASEIMDVRVTKTPLELVVTSTSPVKVSTPPVESVEVKVVVYSVHPEHSEEVVSEIMDVRVTKSPFEFVVTSTSPVNV